MKVEDSDHKSVYHALEHFPYYLLKDSRFEGSLECTVSRVSTISGFVL